MLGKIRNLGTTVTSPQKGDNADTLYTVPARHYAEIAYLTVSNGSNAERFITVEYYISESDTYFDICDETSLPANSTLFVVGDGEKMFMNAGDKIVVSVNSNQMDAFISAVEVYRDSTQ